MPVSARRVSALYHSFRLTTHSLYLFQLVPTDHGKDKDAWPDFITVNFL